MPASVRTSGTCSNWVIAPRDRTPNELEIWYSGEDVFDVTLIAPNGREFTLALDHRMRLRQTGPVWGNFYHRLREPNSGLNHVAIYLYPGAPSGMWRIALRGRDVVDGRRARLDRARREPPVPIALPAIAGLVAASRRTRSAIAFARSPSAPTTPPAGIGRPRGSAAAVPRPTAGRSRRSRRPAT